MAVNAALAVVVGFLNYFPPTACKLVDDIDKSLVRMQILSINLYLVSRTGKIGPTLLCSLCLVAVYCFLKIYTALMLKFRPTVHILATLTCYVASCEFTTVGGETSFPFDLVAVQIVLSAIHFFGCRTVGTPFSD